ncbi:MAG TPA: hypothetical protein VM030_08945 [Acidimicrobiales bacterium]|nr:hypothetical protein [Acidimicrobiales bacterium]
MGLAPIMIAGTAAPAAAATGPYGGNAFVDLVHLTAVEGAPGILADVSVAPAKADVLSTGLPAPTGPARSYARSTNLDADLAAGNIPATGLLVLAEQKAPPNNAAPTVDEIGSLPANPLLAASLAKATAHARWLGDATCVAPGTPISLAQSEVADAAVAPGAGGTSVVALDNQQGSTVYTKSTVGLVNVAGSPNKGVKAEALTQLTALTLFKNSPNETTINVLAPPVVTAVATGQPGGAKVTYSEPILQIVRAGTVVGELNAVDINQTIAIPSGILKIDIGTLTKTEKADGTEAKGSATLLTVSLVDGSPIPVNLITPFSIAAGTVSAKVPAGGVECGVADNPLRDAHKDLSAADVSPGQTFTYDVVVPNRGACTLTNVKVVDTVTGPEGSTIVSTVPPASTTDGLKLTWNDIGPLAPNETKTLVITVKVPDNAPQGAVYKNNMTVTGKCDGADHEKSDEVVGPTVGPNGTGGCNLGDSNKAASHKEVFPGETFNYYIHVFNSGGAPCTGVTVSDNLIADVDFVSCTDDCKNAGKAVTWAIGDLAPGQSRTLTVTVKASTTVAEGKRLPDTAILKASNGSAVTVKAEGPLVTKRSVLAGPNPARRGSGQLPATGGGAAAAGFGALLLGAAVMGLRLRRRVVPGA